MGWVVEGPVVQGPGVTEWLGVVEGVQVSVVTLSRFYSKYFSLLIINK